MALMQAPVGIILLHRVRAQEARDRDRHPRLSTPPVGSGPLAAARTRIGRIMIAAGTRIAAQHDLAEPAVGTLSTAR